MANLSEMLDMLKMSEFPELLGLSLGSRDLARLQQCDSSTFASFDRAGLWQPLVKREVPHVSVAQTLLERSSRGPLMSCLCMFLRAARTRGLRFSLATLADVELLSSQLQSAFQTEAEYLRAGGSLAAVVVGRFDLKLRPEAAKTVVELDALKGPSAGAVRGQLQLKLALRGKDFLVGARHFPANEADPRRTSPPAPGAADVMCFQANVASASAKAGIALRYREAEVRADGVLRRAEHGLWSARDSNGAKPKAARDLLCVLCLRGCSGGTGSGVADESSSTAAGRFAEALQLDYSGGRPRRFVR
eukprot:TRINITY_DN6204_c0_g1_i2.p1 TRINITY_DN6204_c0_g1~~TRINITY_DN6204_c0_g1_i2.p1  ORF type:complete len:324 (-),score=59.03 TRINITY_DN6204_c0_g1_i2:328-1239(-)